MNQGTGGLLALCILLGGLAFGVLFVAPRYIGEAERPAAEQAEVASAPLASQDGAGAEAANEDATRQAAVPQDSAPAGDAAPSQVDTGTGSAADALPGIDDLADLAAAALGGGEDAVPPEGDPALPQFDLLRVEPDGSAVVAGRAQPGRQLEILSGEEIIASVEVGPSGAFATVLDEPLAPGAHSLTLQARGEDDELVRSDEVATVNIPQGDGGELLAMVSRPGEASRIISRPEPAETDRAAAPVPASDPEPAAAPQPAASEPAVDEPEVAATDDIADTDQPVDTVAQTEDVPGIEAAARDDDASAAGSERNVAASAASAPVDGDTAAEASEPSVPSGDEAADNVAASEPPAAGAGESDAAELAALAPPAPETAEERREAPAASLRIDAVEVEGDRLYVAGSSPPRATVRVYAGETVVGDSRASAEGRFLVEGRVPLAVGEHRIRADLIENGRVVARAVVPFHRPAGDVAAAVARADEATGESREAAPVEAGAPPPADEAPAAPATASGAAPANEAVETEAASADPVRETRDAEQAPAAADSASSPISEGEPAGSDTAAVADPANEAADGDAAAASVPSAGTAAAPPAEQTARAETAPPAGDDEPVTIEQAALTPSDESVIIRRGDTLWQISRRVYGQGVRYTTIYLANQEQIANPDRILPGQIFSVPEQALENAEQLHRERLSR